MSMYSPLSTAARRCTQNPSLVVSQRSTSQETCVRHSLCRSFYSTAQRNNSINKFYQSNNFYRSSSGSRSDSSIYSTPTGTILTGGIFLAAVTLLNNAAATPAKLESSASAAATTPSATSPSTTAATATTSPPVTHVEFTISRKSSPVSTSYHHSVPFFQDDQEEGAEWIPPLVSDTKQSYDISARAMKGGRVTMEDEFIVANGGKFAAVFDGHGGGGVSNFLKRQLYNQMCRYLEQAHWEQHHDHDDNNNNHQKEQSVESQRPSVSAQVTALRRAFEQVEHDVLEDDTLCYQGSTAVAVVLHESEDGHKTLLSANVGDSRAILSRKGKAVDLTKDHKPNEGREKARILAMGETIEWDRYAKVHRVRNLSLSRAIGDRYAKPVVSGEVEIKRFPVSEESDEFVLLASDGLWDVMRSQDVVDFVHKRLESELSRQGKDGLPENMKLRLRREMAKYVAREAIRQGSGDNVCVVMVWLNDCLPRAT